MAFEVFAIVIIESQVGVDAHLHKVANGAWSVQAHDPREELGRCRLVMRGNDGVIERDRHVDAPPRMPCMLRRKTRCWNAEIAMCDERGSRSFGSLPHCHDYLTAGSGYTPRPAKSSRGIGRVLERVETDGH